jgi:antitoxin component YwqK of YwqJK toxin-antitoxin module
MKQGSWKEFYENDAVKNEGFYRDGKRDGIFRELDRNGRVTKKEEYRNDILVETVKVVEERYDVKRNYYDDGKLKSIGTSKRGLPDGIFREYDVNGNLTDTAKIYSEGKLLRQGKLDDQGREQGLWREFYEDGKIKSEGNYKDGKREKPWNFYFNNGQVEQTGEYVKGKPSGEWKKYFQDGNLNRDEFYDNGKENGIMTEYARDSTIIAKGNYVDGKKDGVWNFNNNGYIATGKFLEDREDGLWKQYTADKRVIFEGSFVDGQENGEHTYYFEDGRVKEKQQWRIGLREGTWKKYDAAGNLIIEISYAGGNEVKLNGVKVSQ